MKPQRTYQAKPGEVARRWVMIDAEGKILGRVATQVATILRGKHKPQYTPHVDCGDFVVLVNASKVRTTGDKESDKVYYRHSGYPGGIKSVVLAEQRRKKPEEIIRSAVKGMLPKGTLGTRQLKKLKIYPLAEHRHSAQHPDVIK